jgi:hypothetical protein
MTREEVKNGTRVIFVGPPEGTVVTFFDAANHKLLGKFGTILYGRSEDIWVEPDNPESDLVWVQFDEDRFPRRQVSAAWLDRLHPW